MIRFAKNINSHIVSRATRTKCLQVHAIQCNRIHTNAREGAKAQPMQAGGGFGRTKGLIANKIEDKHFTQVAVFETGPMGEMC